MKQPVIQAYIQKEVQHVTQKLVTPVYQTEIRDIKQPII